MMNNNEERKTAKPHICLSPSMFADAKERAYQNRQSFSEYVCYLIEQDLKANPIKKADAE